VADGPARFELTPSERFMAGTELDGGVLVLRPTAPRRVEAVVGVLSTVVVAVFAIAISWRGPVWLRVLGCLFAITVVGAGVAVAGAFVMSRVVANTKGLVVRDRWRRVAWRWDEIDSVTVADATPGRVRTSPALLLSWQPLPGQSTPVVRLVDGRSEPLWVLSSTKRGPGFSMSGATPAEIRAGILARYQSAVVGHPPTYVPPPPT
jgi:hypothetical protein